MEVLFFGLFIIFAALSLVLLLLIIYEYKELKRYNQEFTLLASAISEIAEVVNKNAESSKQETVLVRENTLEIVLIKQLLDIHSKALAYTLPSKQWEEVVEALRKSFIKENIVE